MRKRLRQLPGTGQNTGLLFEEAWWLISCKNDFNGFNGVRLD